LDLNSFFVRATYDILIKKLDQIIKNKFNIELYYDAEVIDNADKKELIKIKERLIDVGLELIAHGPFIDLHIASLDKLIQEASYQRLLKSINFAKDIGIKEIILHHGYDERIHGYKFDTWLDYSKQNWDRLTNLAGDYGIEIVLENTFEKEPLVIEKLIFELSLPFKVCIDIGHLNVTSKNNLFGYLPKWLKTFNQHIVELHLHDNKGEEDLHLTLGEGSINFIKLFNLIDKFDINPRITLENKTENELYQSIIYLYEIAKKL